MDLNFTPEEEAFRAEVQAFLKDKLPARIADKVKAGQRLTKADQDEWHAIPCVWCVQRYLRVATPGSPATHAARQWLPTTHPVLHRFAEPAGFACWAS